MRLVGISDRYFGAEKQSGPQNQAAHVMVDFLGSCRKYIVIHNTACFFWVGVLLCPVEKFASIFHFLEESKSDLFFIFRPFGSMECGCKCSWLSFKNAAAETLGEPNAVVCNVE